MTLARSTLNLERLSVESKQIFPPPSDFCDFVPWACHQFALEFIPVITKTQYVDRAAAAAAAIHTPLSKKKKSAILDSELSTTAKSESIVTTTKSSKLLQHCVYITAVYNNDNNLVQIKIRNKAPPRTLLKVIGLTLPFQQYVEAIIFDHVNQAIIHDIAKMMNISNITEIYLDRTFVPQANYHILLDSSNCKVLSLSKCQITDIVVETIARKIDYETVGSKNLLVLNLTANTITDIGAKYLANALRTNRKLAYLNLAGNHISDEGAKHLLEVLKEFPLTDTELCRSIEKHGVYLKQGIEFIVNLFDEYKFNDITKSDKKRSAKNVYLKKSTDLLKKSAASFKKDRKGNQYSTPDRDEMLLRSAQADVIDGIEKYADPFSLKETRVIEGVHYCLGNNTLSYLNFAYNNLTYFSVKAIRDVLIYQSNLCRKPRGLLNVIIEGNLIPETCAEYIEIDQIFDSILTTNNEMKTGKKNTSKKKN